MNLIFVSLIVNYSCLLSGKTSPCLSEDVNTFSTQFIDKVEADPAEEVYGMSNEENEPMTQDRQDEKYFFYNDPQEPAMEKLGENIKVPRRCKRVCKSPKRILDIVLCQCKRKGNN